jgi:ParB family chromosome partitioning protein
MKNAVDRKNILWQHLQASGMEGKMAVRKGLGKGLDSLIVSKNEGSPEKEKKEIITENVSHETLVKITQIEPNRGQPRQHFNEDSLQELADSIKQHGIIEPLIVQKKGGQYDIIAGERRWRAARLAGLKEVPVIVKEYSDQEVFEIALIENIQRENLNPIEEAVAYKKLIDEFCLKQDDVANRVGKSRTAVTNSMRLLKLDNRVQQMLVEDMLSSGHARALLGLDDLELQYQTAMKIFDEKLSVREVERLVKKMTEETPEKEEKKEIDIEANNEAVYRDLEEKLKTIIGSKVMINRKSKDKGKIEIEYYSSEELERIVDLMNQIQGK